METTLPRLIRDVSIKHPDVVAQYSRTKDGQFTPTTYKDMFKNAMDFGAGLLSLGVERGEKIGLISDNRKEWEQSDLGLLAIGAVDVPRGCDASPNDLKYILSFTECRFVISENPAQITKILNLKSDIPTLKTMICFEEPTEENFSQAKKAGVVIFRFNEILEKGIEYRAKNDGVMEKEIEVGQWDDIAGIIFTSGTTGTPKGVMLSHGNFITQLDELNERIHLEPADRAICVLPVWHVFQRLVEYVIMNQGASLCYSKPIASILLADFATINPMLLPAVPRVFEALMDGVNRQMRRTGGIACALYTFFTNVAILHSRMHRKLFRQSIRFGNDWIVFWWPVLVLPWLLLFPLKLLGNVLVFSKIKAKFGNSFRAGIAGGGAYPSTVDEYFWALGINIVEGYGMTETAPVVAVRHISKPVFGCIGTAIRGVNVRIVDMDGNVLPKCTKGVLQVKGGTVMKGYYKRPELTEKAINKDGWLDTGDLAMLGVNNEIKIMGRVKDTIVLRGGENVEPLPIEEKLKESKYIDTVVVVGQDQRNLGALVFPNREELELYAKENNIPYSTFEELVENPDVYKFYDGIIREIVSQKNGFRMFEKIPRFAFVTRQLEVGRELSAKQELMRYKIAELYEKELKQIFHE